MSKKGRLLNADSGKVSFIVMSYFLIEQWKKEYNQVHPHNVRNYCLSATETVLSVVVTLKVVPLLGAGHGNWLEENGFIGESELAAIRELV